VRMFQDLMPLIQHCEKFDWEIGRKANFKFFPQENVFDEQKFRHQVSKEDYLRLVLPHVPGGVDAWVAEVKRWYAKGL
jgi:hypothetical protein